MCLHRIFWITAFGFSVVGCRSFVSEMFQKFREDHIMFSYDDLGFKIEKVKFGIFCHLAKLKSLFFNCSFHSQL